MKGYVKDVALFMGRHEMPESVHDSIYAHNIDPVDVATAERLALTKLRELAADGVVGINLYTTGLTMALLAALNAASRCGVEVKVWHYYFSADPNIKRFYPQEIYQGKPPAIMRLSSVDKSYQENAAKAQKERSKWRRSEIPQNPRDLRHSLVRPTLKKRK